MTMSDVNHNKEGHVETPEGRLWYGISGETDSTNTPMIVIHGGPGMSHHYLLPLQELSAERPVIFYDQLDAGLSDRPNNPQNWHLDRFLKEIDFLREALDIPKLILFGNSWGGTLAAAYASSKPAGIERVILSSPLINTERWLSDNHRYRLQLPAETIATMNQCEATGNTQSEEYLNAVDVFYKRHFCRIDPWPDYLEKTFDLLNEQCYSGMWGPNEFTCSGVLKNYDGTSALRNIKAPTLVTCGEFDEATPTSCRKFVEYIPDAQFLEFEGASHLAFIEVRKKYLSAISEFIA